MATLAVLKHRHPTTWRQDWHVWVALDGDPVGEGLIIGSGTTRAEAIAEARATLETFTDLLLHTAELDETRAAAR